MSLGKQQKNPGPEKADEWYEGFNACNIGTERHRNPYIRESEEYEWWRRGWEARFYNEPMED